MERINRLIRSTILEIAICIAIIIVSVPIWQSFDIKKYETIAASFNNMNYIESDFEVSDLSSYILYQTTDMDALKIIEPIIISYDAKISNTYLVISKNSSLDYRSLKINYDGENYSLLNLNAYEEDDKYYVFLPGDEEEMQHSLKLWIDCNSEYDTYNKELIFNIENVLKQDL